jgi:deoxyribonuclease IV
LTASPAALGTHLSLHGDLAGVPARAAAMGAQAVQLFLGNPRGWATPAGLPAADAAFREAAAARGLVVLVLLEPTAGQGTSLAARVDDLGPYLDALERHPRVRICLDTCHAFVAGHDLAAPAA